VRLREVFEYEFAYRLRSGSTWMYAVFLFLIMFWGSIGTAGALGAVKANAPQHVAQSTVLFGGLFGLLVSAAFFADAAIRDIAAGMDPLLFTTRLRKAEYLGGRFLAALAINAIVVMAVPLGFAAATVSTFLEPEALGPFRLAAYVQPLVLFLLPNLVLVGAILLTIAIKARKVIPVYLGAAGIFIGYIVAANYWSGLGNPIPSTLADPLGINALIASSRYLTPAELNTRLIGFPPLLLWNRLIWLAIAAAVLAVLHRNFRFAHHTGVGRERSRVPVDMPVERHSPVYVAPISGVFGIRTLVRQTFAIARESLVEVTSGRAFQVALLAAIGLVMLWGWNVGDTAFETPAWPVTHLIVMTVLLQRSMAIPWLIIALYAGELVWKDRTVGAAEIVDAAPVVTGVMLLGRFLALIAIIVAFHAAFIVGGLLIQTFQGYHHYELGLYLRAIFGLSLADHVLLAALAMMVHVIVNQKYVGHLIVLGACVLTVIAGPLGLSYLLVYDSGPRLLYSDMNGFGPFLRPVLWFKLYWSAWALLLAVITILFWVRGREPGLRHRIRAARARFHGAAARSTAVAVALIISVGGFVYYNTNILNENVDADDAGRHKAEYEQRYTRFADAAQPTITKADLRIEIYPSVPAVDLRGSYQLVNSNLQPIDSVHVYIDREVDAHSISLSRAARPLVVDQATGYRIYALERPLAPGDSMRLSFEVAFRRRGFRSTGIQTAVVGNGSFFNRKWLPFIGYQPAFELSDDATRKRFGLPPRPPTPEPNDMTARRYDGVIRNEGHVVVETLVGTAADQIAVVTGTLRRSWTENGRRYFQYGTDVPVPFGTAVFSARYAVRKDHWNDIALQVLHHSDHGYDVDRMLVSIKAALDYYTRTFGPYQFQDLRIAEEPPYSINARAHVTTVAFAEQNFITRDRPGEVDQTFFGTAHEVAHSWWGGQVRPAAVRGGPMLSETLANYSAMMLTERFLGPEQARRVYDYQMDRYLSRRAAFSRDVPLVEVEDQPHISYGKGAVAMYTLREQIGDQAVNTALRRFLAKYRDSGPPYPTSLDLLMALRSVTPDSLEYLLTDLFKTVTLWNVKTERAMVENTSTGEYRVTLDVSAKKMRADSIGDECEVPMNDYVEIGVFAPRKGEGLGAPLYLQRHRIHSGRQTIQITVPREPSRAGIDPYRKLIERDRGDNVLVVEGSSSYRHPAGGD
jgi:ABC-2 type transport system permease protein